MDCPHFSGLHRSPNTYLTTQKRTPGTPESRGQSTKRCSKATAFKHFRESQREAIEHNRATNAPHSAGFQSGTLSITTVSSSIHELTAVLDNLLNNFGQNRLTNMPLQSLWNSLRRRTREVGAFIRTSYYILGGAWQFDRQRYKRAYVRYRKAWETGGTYGANSLSNAIESAVMAKMYSETLDLVNLAGESEQFSPKIHVLIGMSYSELGRFENAIPILEAEAGSADEGISTAARRLLAYAYCENDRFEDAEPLYRQLLESDPCNCQLLTSYACTLNQLSRYDEAFPVWEKLCKINNEDRTANLGLGAAAIHTDQSDSAIAAYSRLLSIDPDDTEARAYLAMAYANDNKYEKAFEEFSRANELRPKWTVALYGLANACFYVERFEEAMEFAEQINIQSDEYCAAQILIALCMENSGRQGEALDRYRNALRICPDDGQAAQNASALLFELERYQEALDLNCSYPTDVGDSAWVHANIGRALLNLGRTSDAIPPLEKAITMAPAPDVFWRELLAEAYHDLGIVDAVNRQLSAIADIEPLRALDLERDLEIGDTESE